LSKEQIEELSDLLCEHAEIQNKQCTGGKLDLGADSTDFKTDLIRALQRKGGTYTGYSGEILYKREWGGWRLFGGGWLPKANRDLDSIKRGEDDIETKVGKDEGLEDIEKRYHERLKEIAIRKAAAK